VAPQAPQSLPGRKCSCAAAGWPQRQRDGRSASGGAGGPDRPGAGSDAGGFGPISGVALRARGIATACSTGAATSVVPPIVIVVPFRTHCVAPTYLDSRRTLKRC
jgi:hypothetical protein